MKRKANLVAFASIVGLAVLAPSWSAVAQTTTLKITGCLPRNHDYIEAFHDAFITPLNAKGTDLQLRYLGGTEVTPRGKQAPALKRGLIDIIHCPGAYYGGVLSEARLAGVQNRSLEEIRANGGWDMMQEAWGKGLNARILAWVHFKGQKFYIYTRFKPKLSEKTGLDLTGVKMRSTGLYNALFKAMGATTIVITPTDVYAALQRGVVQGLAWPWGSVAKLGWEGFLEYRVEPSFYGASMLMLINRDKYNSLSQSQKDLLNSQARIFEETSDDIIIRKGIIDDARIKKAGVKRLILKGKVRKAYLATIYGAKWADNDKRKYIVDYKKLKAKLYAEPDS